MNYLKKYLLPPLVSFITTFGMLWTFSEPIGLPTGWKLFLIIFLGSAILTSYYYLLNQLNIVKNEKKNLEKKVKELRKKESYCCITMQEEPICPLGVSRIISNTEDTIRTSLSLAKRKFRWIGLSSFNVVHNNYDIFQKKKNVEFVFNILDPEDTYLQKRVDEYYGDVRGKIGSKQLIELSNELINKIKKELNSNVFVKHHRQMPTFRLIFVDDNYLFVSFYERGIDALKTFQLEFHEDERVRFPIKKWFEEYYDKFEITEDAINKKIDHEKK